MRHQEDRLQKSRCVKGLVDKHGWPIDTACREVSLSVADYLPDVKPYAINEFMPKPCEIRTMAAGIRSGKIAVSPTSVQRWKGLREIQEYNDEHDAYDLAGRIDDDAFTVPDWLYSADRVIKTLGHSDSA